MYVTSSDTTSSMSELLLIEALSQGPGTTVGGPLALSSSTQPVRRSATDATTTSSAFHPTLVVNSATPSSDVASNWTDSSITASAEVVGVQLPVGVVIVIVLAAACVVLGAIYGYIYFTRIGPESAAGSTSTKTRKTTGGGPGSDREHHHHGGDSGHEDGSPDAPFTYTHVFLFRKPSTHHRAATIT